MQRSEWGMRVLIGTLSGSMRMFAPELSTGIGDFLHEPIRYVSLRFSRMKMFKVVLISTLFSTATLMAQPQIGGGVCSSAALSGTYSLSLSGRDVSSSVIFSSVLQGMGTATFDGLSKVTFSLTNNTNQTARSAQTYSGTYSLQANCAGLLTLTSGDSASYALVAYNEGKDFLITGADGTYSLTGSGSLMPTVTCAAALLTGSYAFNGSGFALKTGSVSAVNNISGVLQFDGTSAITGTWYVTASGQPTTANLTGQYAVTSGCGATATVTDGSGNTYALVMTITAASGSNFIVSGASPSLMFSGSGRTALSTTGSCSAATLNGTRSLVLTGRNLSASLALNAIYQAVGTATFDGIGSVTFHLTVNTNQGQSAQQTLSGSYTIASGCVGAVSITSGDSATYTLIPYNDGKNFVINGQDAAYTLTGSGGTQPVTCATATLSGYYGFSGNGFLLSGTSVTGVNSISGLLQFNGAGAVTGTWSVATNGTPVADSVSGNYAVTSGCLATATVTDTGGTSYTFAVTATSAAGADFSANLASTQTAFSVSGHSTFTNPAEAVVNAASYVASSTPPGSLFSVFGSGLATGATYATKVPLPTTLATTSVTVNGEAAPLFYADQYQVNAQMPLDIQPGVATVVVKNGPTVSNSVAVVVPATGTPGFFYYQTNRAVVVNPNGSINSTTAAAKVGDVLVGYFTGGGPVNAAGPLVTGAGSPYGLSPVTGNVTVTVGGVNAVVNYIGLAPDLVGVYQLNFVVPAVAAGSRPVAITIAGATSPNEVITVSN